MVKRGEIWLVGLDPAIGHEIKKTRPALVVQNDRGNKYGSTTIVAPLTSQSLDHTYPFEVLIEKKKGIPKQSKVLLNQIRTVDKARLIKKISSIPLNSMRDVDSALKISLGLS